jgi:hypothetical protein
VTPDAAVCPRCPEPRWHPGRPTAQASGSVCGRAALFAHEAPVTVPAGRRPCAETACDLDSSGPGGSATRCMSCHVHGGCGQEDPCPPWWPACDRATGHPSSLQIVADSGMALNISLATCVGHQLSGRDRSKKQRTVNPPLVPCCRGGWETLLYILKAGLRAAFGRPRPASSRRAVAVSNGQSHRSAAPQTRTAWAPARIAVQEPRAVAVWRPRTGRSQAAPPLSRSPRCAHPAS